MPEYSVIAIVVCAAVIAWECLYARTGVFRDRKYWIAMAIVFFFQVLVDGWLTKSSSPVVLYASDEITGVRFPFDIPIEDYFFGFALVTLALVEWRRAR